MTGSREGGPAVGDGPDEPDRLGPVESGVPEPRAVEQRAAGPRAVDADPAGPIARAVHPAQGSTHGPPVIPDTASEHQVVDAGAAGHREVPRHRAVEGLAPERRGVFYVVPANAGSTQSPSHEDDGAADGPGPASPGATGQLLEDGLVSDAEAADREDWVWVQEWRAGREPTPWATGIALAAFSALVVGVAMWVLCAGLSNRPVIAVLVNLLVAAGLTPAIWLSRGLPVLRWIAAGAAVGIVVGWISAILLLPPA